MGSTVYTFEQAASRLKRSKRSVHNYVKKGLIRREFHDGMAGVSAADVEDLVRQEAFPAMNRENWIELVSRVRRLEERYAVMSEIMGLRYNPLRPNKENSEELYRAARRALTESFWESKEVDMWTGLFGRIDETTLQMMSSHVPDSQPWMPFFELCRRMQDHVGGEYASKETVEIEKRYLKLEECRKHLRAIAVVWSESGRGLTSSAILKATASGKETLLERMAGKSS